MRLRVIAIFLVVCLASWAGPLVASNNDATVFPPVTMQNQECGADQLRVLSWAKGATSTICLTGQEVIKLAIPTCAANQQVVFDGTTYVCRTPTAIPTCTPDQYLSFDGTSYACKTNKAPPTCTASQVLSFNGADYVCIERTNNVPVCSASQFLTYNGSAYQCADVQKLALPVCGVNQFVTSDGTTLRCSDSSKGKLLFAKNISYDFTLGDTPTSYNAVVAAAVAAWGPLVNNPAADGTRSQCSVDPTTGHWNNANDLGIVQGCGTIICNYTTGYVPSISQLGGTCGIGDINCGAAGRNGFGINWNCIYSQ